LTRSANNISIKYCIFFVWLVYINLSVFFSTRLVSRNSFFWGESN
jgi:hypothetical protein